MTSFTRGRAAASAVVLGAVALLGGCSSSSAAPPPAACAAGFLGDPAKAIDFVPLVVQADDRVAECRDGDVVPMIAPPQGGRVVFVGVRATNVDGCALQLTGALRDLTTQQVRLDSRTVNLSPTGTGWGVTGAAGGSASGTISSFANVPVCPNQWASSDLEGHTFGLEVTIQDRAGRQLTKSVQVKPACGEPATAADCRCTCRAGYVLGEVCADAGDAGDAGAP